VRLGGVVGVALGGASTAVYAQTKHWATVIPAEAWAGGIVASVIAARSPGSSPPYEPPASHPSPVVRLAQTRLRRQGPGVAEERSVSPPVSLPLHVVPRALAELGRAEDEDLEALRSGLVPSPCTGRNAHGVPLLDRDDLVVELHPPAPADDHEHLLLLLVRVAVREPVVGRDALIAQAGLLELERLARETELKVRRAVEVGPDVRQILSEVPERERHGRDSTVQASCRRRAASADSGIESTWDLVKRAPLNTMGL
jgi:hypothetical protein